MLGGGLRSPYLCSKKFQAMLSAIEMAAGRSELFGDTVFVADLQLRQVSRVLPTALTSVRDRLPLLDACLFIYLGKNRPQILAVIDSFQGRALCQNRLLQRNEDVAFSSELGAVETCEILSGCSGFMLGRWMGWFAFFSASHNNFNQLFSRSIAAMHLFKKSVLSAE